MMRLTVCLTVAAFATYATGAQKVEYDKTLTFEQLRGGKVVYTAKDVKAAVKGDPAKDDAVQWQIDKKTLPVLPKLGDRFVDEAGRKWSIKDVVTATSGGYRLCKCEKVK